MARALVQFNDIQYHKSVKNEVDKSSSTYASVVNGKSTEIVDLTDVSRNRIDSGSSDEFPRSKGIKHKNSRRSLESSSEEEEITTKKGKKKRQRIASSEESEAEERCGSPSWDQKSVSAAPKLEQLLSLKPRGGRRTVIADEDESPRLENLCKAKSAREQLMELKRRGRAGNFERSHDDVPRYDEEPDDVAEEEFVRPIHPKFQKPSKAQLKDECLAFFNNATPEELSKFPKISPRITDIIVSLRPFRSFPEMEGEFEDTKGLRVELIDSYCDFLETKSNLEFTLSECQRHSAEILHAVNSLKREKQAIFRSNLTSERQLRGYQEIGLQWLVLMNKLRLNAILSDEMGLGKTIQVIAFLAHLNRGPHLIVVPSSTYENWYNELQTWWPDVRILGYYGMQPERMQMRFEKPSDYDVVLTTYNIVSSTQDDKKFIRNIRFQYSVYDEAHLLKNYNTKRYKDLIRIKSLRKLILTGTPLQNDLVELMSIIYFTMPQLFDRDKTGMIFQQFRGTGARSDYEREKTEQAKKILAPFILRRLKKDVLKEELPDKKETIYHCAMTEHQQQLYDEKKRECQELKEDPDARAQNILMELRKAANHPLLVRNIFTDEKLREMAPLLVQEKKYIRWNEEDIVDEFGWKDDFQVHSELKRYPRMHRFLLDKSLFMNSGKFNKLDELLPESQKRGRKVLIFSQFTMVLDILEVYLGIRDHKFVRIDGQTPVLERQPLIDEFNKDPSCFIFLLSTKAGGLGINLVSASVVILHDIDFNPHNDRQAEDRAHRVGQKQDVSVIKLISENTVEEHMLACAKKKLQLESHVVAEGGDKEEEEKTTSNLIKQALGL